MKDLLQFLPARMTLKAVGRADQAVRIPYDATTLRAQPCRTSQGSLKCKPKKSRNPSQIFAAETFDRPG